jgi:NifB/MoaA-like Fe-S oxidoreductase
VYASDEFYVTAGREIPAAKYYDGFPQTENGVGLVRSFVDDFNRQAKKLPARLSKRRRIVLATGVSASSFMRHEILPRLQKVGGLDVELVVATNTLFGESVTVAGLLSGKCLYSAMRDKNCGDLVLLPLDILNGDGLFLDDATVPQLEDQLDVPVMIYDGSWDDVFSHLKNPKRSRQIQDLLPILNPRLQSV